MEGKSNLYLLGVLAGVAVGILAWVLFKGKLRRENKDDVDERQLRVRGRAYQICAFLYMAELGLLLVLDGMAARLPLTSQALHTLALLLPIGVFAVYCIFHDAYLGLHANRKNFLILGLVLVGIEIMATFRMLRAGELVVDGRLTGDCIHPLVGLLWLVILGSLLLRKGQIDREDEE